jgi:hypothetical protein
MSVRDSIDEYDFAARHLGTLRHFDHILLENALVWGNGSSYDCPASNKSGAGSNSWNQPSCAGKVTWAGNESIIAETILPLFERMFAPLGEPLHINTNGASGASWFHYSEANIAGNIPYPHGIKFVIVTFPVLFGTGNVTAVREWCVQRGWPLVCESPRTVPLDFRLRMHSRGLDLHFLLAASTPIDLNLFEHRSAAHSRDASYRAPLPQDQEAETRGLCAGSSSSATQKPPLSLCRQATPAVANPSRALIAVLDRRTRARE